MAVAAEVVAEAQLIEHRRGFRRRWYRTPSFVAGASILATIVLAALAAPLITQHDPAQQDLLHTLAGPSSSHWLGTDDLGRDVWSRLVYGARTDLRVAFLAVLFPFVIGTVIGLLSGYYGRWIDTVTNWLVNVVVAFPFYFSGSEWPRTITLRAITSFILCPSFCLSARTFIGAFSST